jgi:hypothetical protein
VASEWVQAEVHWALEKRKGRVIPILLRDCDPADLHLKLMRIQYIDFRTNQELAAMRLLAAVSEPHQGTPAAAAMGTVNLETTRVAAGEGIDVDATVIAVQSETMVLLAATQGPHVGSEFSLTIAKDCVLGRAMDADLQLLDDQISRHHARISCVAAGPTKQLFISDLGSTNGTFVNEHRVTLPQSLSAGDVIDVGRSRLVVKRVSY